MDGGWSTEGFSYSGTSGWAATSNRGSDLGHSPDWSMRFGSGGNAQGGGSYVSDADTTLYSPEIDLTGLTGPITLEFTHFLDLEPGYDDAEVIIRSGGTRTVLASTRDGTLPSTTGGFRPVSLDLSAFAGQKIDSGPRRKGLRKVYFPESGFVDCPVYNRYALMPGTTLHGPAIIEERESTVVAGADARIFVDDHLNVVIDIDAPGSAPRVAHGT